MFSLKQQNIDKNTFEVIVVDNNSIDITKDVVQQFILSGLNVIYAYESNISLCASRNKGVRLSRGDIIAFMDDDALASPNWVHEIIKTYQIILADCIGGKVDLIWEDKRPSWLTEDLFSYMSQLHYNTPDIKVIRRPDYLVGTNISFKRNVFDKVGFFSEGFSRKGEGLLTSDELDFCIRLEKVGGLIYYSNSIQMSHVVMKSRLSKIYFLRRAFWQGVSDARLDIKHGWLTSFRPKNNVVFYILDSLKFALFLILLQHLITGNMNV